MLPVLILSGGLATRMQQVTGNIPKAMLNVAGKPFIHWQLNMLRNQGVKNVILCIGYLGEMIEKYAGNGTEYGLNLTYSYDGEKLLGTGGAIKKIEEYLPEAFFVLYGDSYLDIPYAPVENAFKKSGKTGLMTVYENKDLYDVSNVVFQNGVLVDYSKKHKTAQMRHIDYGLGILRKEAFSGFPKYEFLDLADVYVKLVNEKQLLGFEVFERFYEIGSPEGLQELRIRLRTNGHLESRG